MGHQLLWLQELQVPFNDARVATGSFIGFSINHWNSMIEPGIHTCKIAGPVIIINNAANISACFRLISLLSTWNGWTIHNSGLPIVRRSKRFGDRSPISGVINFSSNVILPITYCTIYHCFVIYYIYTAGSKRFWMTRS